MFGTRHALLISELPVLPLLATPRRSHSFSDTRRLVSVHPTISVSGDTPFKCSNLVSDSFSSYVKFSINFLLSLYTLLRIHPVLTQQQPSSCSQFSTTPFLGGYYWYFCAWTQHLGRQMTANRFTKYFLINWLTIIHPVVMRFTSITTSILTFTGISKYFRHQHVRYLWYG